MKNSIVCPKCKNKTLRILDVSEKSVLDLDVFCDTCRLFFGWNELNKYWNIDIGDFYDVETAKCNHYHIESFPPFVPEIFVQYAECVDCGKRWYADINTVSEPEFENFGEYLIYQYGVFTLSKNEYYIVAPEIDFGFPVGAVGSS